MMLKVSEVFLTVERELEVTNVLCVAMISPRCRALPEPEAVLWAD